MKPVSLRKPMYCVLCGTKAEMYPGVGHYCPKKGCSNVDGDSEKEMFTTTKPKKK